MRHTRSVALGAPAPRWIAGRRALLQYCSMGSLLPICGACVGSACWWSEADAARVERIIAPWQVKLAIADKAEGKVHIFDTKTGSNTPIHTLSTGKPTLHMRFNYKYETLVTTDAAGMISYWSSTEFKHPTQVVSFKHKVRTRSHVRVHASCRMGFRPSASPRTAPRSHGPRTSRQHTKQELSLCEKYL
jgi:hypothetical protein